LHCKSLESDLRNFSGPNSAEAGYSPRICLRIFIKKKLFKISAFSEVCESPDWPEWYYNLQDSCGFNSDSSICWKRFYKTVSKAKEWASNYCNTSTTCKWPAADLLQIDVRQTHHIAVSGCAIDWYPGDVVAWYSHSFALLLRNCITATNVGNIHFS